MYAERVVRCREQSKRNMTTDTMENNDAAVSPQDPSPFINLRDTDRFLPVLEALKCSLAISRRPSGVALLGVDNGIPTLSACLLPRSMGLAAAGNRLAIATIH